LSLFCFWGEEDGEATDSPTLAPPTPPIATEAKEASIDKEPSALSPLQLKPKDEITIRKSELGD
jgi:hypothetical protein